MSATADEEMDSIANLLRTFLPDNENLPATDNAAQLLQQFKSSIGQTSMPTFNNQYNLQVYPNEQHAYNNAYSFDPNTEGANVDSEDISRQQEENKTESLMQHNEKKVESDPDWEPDKFDDNDNNSGDSDATIDIPMSELSSMISVVKNKEVITPVVPNQHLPMCVPRNVKKEFGCFICDARFTQLDLYTEHMKAHCDDPIDMKCFDCGERFNRKAAFSNHHRLSSYELWVDKNKRLRNSVKEEMNDESGNGKL